jgi:hypothetical protein
MRRSRWATSLALAISRRFQIESASWEPVALKPAWSTGHDGSCATRLPAPLPPSTPDRNVVPSSYLSAVSESARAVRMAWTAIAAMTPVRNSPRIPIPIASARASACRGTISP